MTTLGQITSTSVKQDKTTLHPHFLTASGRLYRILSDVSNREFELLPAKMVFELEYINAVVLLSDNTLENETF